MSVEVLFDAINFALSWPTVGWIAFGLVVGIIFGIIPGLGSSLGMIILLPFTIPMEPNTAIVMLISIYCGAMYGGSVTAILINVPGTASSAATTFDGYPMAKLGRAKDALAISATAGPIGGLLSVLLLFLITPFLLTVVLATGSPEYFLMAFIGVALITVVSRGSMVKGLTAGFFGLALTSIGIASTGEVRFILGIRELFNGISYIAALLGMFAIAEMLRLAVEQGQIAKKDAEVEGSIINGIRESVINLFTVIKSGLIGMGVGIVPGSGASVSNFVSYAEQVRSSKNADKYGEGEPKGVMASEASNNATVAGALVPTLSFGIPGSGATAVLLGALLLHGIRPGPSLFTDELILTYSMLIALIIGNILIFIIGITLINRASFVTKVNVNYIIPIVIVFSIIGGLILRNNWIDIYTVLVFGIVGYWMKKHDYSVIAFVLGVVLGPIVESNFLRSLRLSGGSFKIFVDTPLSLALTIALLFILSYPILNAIRDRRQSA